MFIVVIGEVAGRGCFMEAGREGFIGVEDAGVGIWERRCDHRKFVSCALSASDGISPVVANRHFEGSGSRLRRP